MHADSYRTPLAPPCTLGQLVRCLEELELSEEQMADVILDVVRTGQVRVIGGLLDALGGLVGVPPPQRRH